MRWITRPVFQVTYEYQSASLSGLKGGWSVQDGQVQIRLEDRIRQEGEYPLVLEVAEGAQGYALYLKQSGALAAGEAQRLLQRYEGLLEQVLEDPQRELRQYELLWGQERDEVDG